MSITQHKITFVGGPLDGKGFMFLRLAPTKQFCWSTPTGLKCVEYSLKERAGEFYYVAPISVYNAGIAKAEGS